jgi:signal transduction histidine kinase
MPVSSMGHPRIWPPWLAWGIVLAVVLATEFGIMLGLPRVLPAEPSRALEAAVDSVSLTVVLAPVLGWLIVRPLRQSARLRERFLVDLFAAMEDERRRIAVELHDGVGQSLTLLVSGLRSLNDSAPPDIARRGRDLRDLADRALRDARHLSQSLRPSLLDDLGLAPAIERIAADVRENHPLAVSVNVDAVAGRRLAGPVESALFRICQEAIANVVRHARATQASILLDLQPRLAVLEIRDNGCGFDPRRLDPTTDGHLGLVGMRERATLLGGELQINSTVGRGTRVIAQIPVEATDHGQDAGHAGR